MSFVYKPYQYVALVVGALIAIAGILGNGFLVWAIYKRRDRGSPTFILVGNQAFSDLIAAFCYFCLLPECSAKMLSVGLFGEVLCGIVHLISSSTMYASAFSMMFISIERWRKVNPENPMKILNLSIGAQILITWALALGLSTFGTFNVPGVVFFNEKQVSGCHILLKTDVSFFQNHYNFVLAIVFGWIIPFGVSAVFYYRVLKKIKAIENTTSNFSNKQQVDAMERNRGKTIRMLITIVIVYFILSTPFFVTSLAEMFITQTPCNDSSTRPVYLTLTLSLFFSSVIVSPVLYCRFNDMLRSEATNVLRYFIRPKFNYCRENPNTIIEQ